jgi:putative transposase
MHTRHSEEQIVPILQEAHSGGKVSELCRRHGISENTFFRWRDKYNGVGVPEVKGMRELEVENGRLKRIVAGRDLEVDALREALQKTGSASTKTAGCGRVDSAGPQRA